MKKARDPGRRCTSMSLISTERMIQIEKGYTSAREDLIEDGSLAGCARRIIHDLLTDERRPDPSWTLHRAEHVRQKYSDAPIRRLVIAAALLVAEIERRQRLRCGESITRRPSTRKRQ